MNRIIRLVSLFIVFPGALTLCASQYYTFEMKDGMVIRGMVISENAERVLIKFEEKDGIAGQTHIIKSEIANRVRIEDDEVAFNKLPSLDLHPRHSFSLKEYNSMISAAEKFLTAFPQSDYALKVTEKLDSIKAERERVAKGEVKSAGEWLGSTQARLMSYDIKANLLRDEILEQSAKNKFPEAKQVFDELERLYPASVAYFQAGVDMVEWLDKQVKSKQIEIAAAEKLAAQLTKNKSNNNARIAEAQAKSSKSGSPNYITTLKNQIASLQSQNAVMEREINGLQTQLSADRAVLAGYSAELSRLRSLAFQNASQQANALKQIEEKFRAGRLSEVKELLKNAELRPFERTRNLNALMEGHDQILQKMRSEIAASKFDAAIETGNQGLKQYPGSDQITALIEQARTARSEAARAVQ